MSLRPLAMVGLLGGIGVLFMLKTATTTAAPVGPVPSSELTPEALQERVMMGRNLVLSHGCGDCHGGFPNPDSPIYLQGFQEGDDPFVMMEEFNTYPRNLTPHNETGTGRFSERQIFNALRYGLRPGETPDVEITSTTPGEGNFPAVPKYLAPPMPWPAFRHMSDEELMAIAAYVKRGLKPVENLVPDSEGPPDFWASLYVPENIGSHPPPAFPGAAEQGGM